MAKLKRLSVPFVALALALTGCGGAVESKPQGTNGQVTVADGDDGYVVYKANCISCHGGDLQGRMGPSLERIGASMTKEQIADKIANGGGGMPAFSKRLREAELEQLASWLAGKK